MAQVYKTGGSGKQYVTNEETGNISVNGKVIKPGESGYAATRAAMESDTGYKMGGNSVAKASNTGGTGTVASGTAANSVSSLSGAGQGNITSNAADMSFTRHVNGQDYKVEPGDPRYSAIMREFLGGLGDQPGWEQNLQQTYGAGGGGGTASGYDRYADIMSQGRNAYEKALRQKLGLAEDVNARAIAATNQAYDQAANNAYIAYMQQQRQMPQQMARMGLAGTGTSESAALGAATNYQNNLNSNEVTRAKALDDLYLALQQNYADAASEQAAYENSLYQALANAYLDQYNTDRNYNYQLSRDSVADQRYADELAYDRQWREKEWQNALDQQNYERQKDRLGIALDYYMPTTELANYMGMTREQLAAYLKRYYGV